MSQFDLSTDDQELVDLLDRVGREKFAPNAYKMKELHERPSDNMKLLGDLGVMGLCMPEEYGGSNRPLLSGVLAVETIARHCPRTGSAALMTISGPPHFIAKWGTKEQKEKFLPNAIAGRTAFSISLTEPQAGTALTDLSTRAVMDGDICRINGQKTFCGSANLNEYILMFVRFGPGSDGIGAVIMDRNTPGLTISPPHQHMNGTPWCELFLENAEVPAENVLFSNGGFRRLMSSYSLERTATGALVLGAAQAAFDMARQYAVERKQFGRSIGEFQFIQGHLADMYLRLEQARLMLYKAVSTGDSGSGRLESSAAKLVTTEAACYVTDQAMQIFGATGMSKEMPLEWLYRFVRPYTVAGGTSDIHRSMIAGELLGMKFDHRGTVRPAAPSVDAG